MTHFQKYWGFYAILAILIIWIIFRKHLFGVGINSPMLHPDGTPCTDANGSTGAYKNGTCITSGGPVPAGTNTNVRVIVPQIIATGQIYRMGYRYIKCYNKILVPGTYTNCANRIFDRSLGYGTLYSQIE